jgi:hypothetical protein
VRPAGHLYRQRLRVESGLLQGAIPFAAVELVVYPTARPNERIVVPFMAVEDRAALESACAGILAHGIEPRIGPATAGPRATLDPGGDA